MSERLSLEDLDDLERREELIQRDALLAAIRREKVCQVCGAIEGTDCLEIFGVLIGKELGCSACIGVSFFPSGKRGNAHMLHPTGCQKITN